jgi:16S rRNA (guanine966-N2)-methyltransferase
MRIVGGKFRGRRLEAPRSQAIRPTADRTREALFNILAGGRFGLPSPVQGAVVLDAFAGSGALGLEALSRGAARVVFLEQDPAAVTLCRANIGALGVEAATEVITADALKPPTAKSPAALLLMDPPYGRDLAGPALEALGHRGWIAAGCLVVVEISAAEALAPIDGLQLLDRRRYGKTELAFLECPKP